MKRASVLTILFVGALVAYSQTSNDLVDFENANGHNPVEFDTVDNYYFYNNYCVQFYEGTLGGTNIPIYAKVGAPRVGFGNSSPATYSTSKGQGCIDDEPSKDDIPVSNNLDEGCFFLTDSDPGPTKEPQPLLVDYGSCIECNFASGYLIDVDGSGKAEGWKIEAFTVSPNQAEKTIYILSDGWQSCSQQYCNQNLTPFRPFEPATDASAKYWEIITNNPIDYLKFTYIGHPERNVGIAFDEFSFCSLAEPEVCELNAEFDYEINEDCEVQFYAQPNVNNFTSPVSYYWDFGDGVTSNEENPTHIYNQPGSYSVCLIITAFTGEICCVSRVCFEISC